MIIIQFSDERLIKKNKQKANCQKEDKIMAKNWKLGEAVRAIQAGNKEDIVDLGRRFPLFSNLAAQVNEAGMAIIDCVPDYCTARKIESVLKGDVQEAAEGEGEGAEEEAPAKKAPAKNEKKAPAKKAAKKAEDEEDDDDSLESKSAKELFDMCKEAGLKVKPKQDKSVYIEALKAAKDDVEEDEEGWGDEEEEEAPKKAPAKGKAKPAAKKAPKKDEDDDDDWEV